MQQQESDGLTGGGATLVKSMKDDVLPFTTSTLNPDALNAGVVTRTKLAPIHGDAVKMLVFLTLLSHVLELRQYICVNTVMYT